MTSFTKYEPGAFSWIDLMSPDTAASKRFHQELFGWDAVDNPTPQGGAYTMFSQQGEAVAGMGAMSDEMKASGMPAIWNSYITVQNINASTARAAEFGASVQMPPMEIPGAGKMSILEDPTGAHFSLWEAGGHIGSGIANEPVSLCWNELATNDTERAAAFYRDLFGWSIQKMGDDYQLIENAGRANGGIMPLGPDRATLPSHWSVCLAVEDCDASIAKATELGGQIYMPPMDVPQGRFGVIGDPHGAAITLMKVLDPD